MGIEQRGFSPEQFNGEQKTLNNIGRIMESGNEPIFHKEELEQYVEPPLLKACEVFYGKGIRTVCTDANIENVKISNNVSIYLDFNHLSDENRLIAKNLNFEHRTNSHYGNVIVIEIPANIHSNVEEISNKAIEVANQFKGQEDTWIKEWAKNDPPLMFDDAKRRMFNILKPEPKLNDEELEKYYSLEFKEQMNFIEKFSNKEFEKFSKNTNNETVFQFWKNKKYYFDSEKKLFYRNKKLYDIANKEKIS